MENSFLNNTFLGRYLSGQYKQPEQVQQEDASQDEENTGYDFKDTSYDKACKYIETHESNWADGSIAAQAGNDAFFGKIDMETQNWIEKLTVEE